MASALGDSRALDYYHYHDNDEDKAKASRTRQEIAQPDSRDTHADSKKLLLLFFCSNMVHV